MKRLIAVMMSFAVMLVSVCCFTIAYADDSYVVQTDDIYAKQGETVTVPLKLSGNKGLMGFKISIKYPDNQLVLSDVSSGSLTANGLFNTTITDYYSVKGKFDIVWSDDAEVKDDGTLFIMTYKVKESSDDGEYKISVTFSQEDTFDEKFKDVKLKCSPIKVYIGDVKASAAEQEETTKSDTGKNNDNHVSDDYLISSTEQIIQSFAQSDMESLTEEQQKTVVEYVNNRVGSYGGGKKYDSFDDLKSDYKEATKREATRKVIESTDPEKIVSVTNEVLKEYGVSSFSDLPTDKKQEAVEKTLQKLAEEGADESGFESIISYDDAAQVLDGIIYNAKSEENNSIEATQSKRSVKNKLWITVGSCVIGIILIGIIVYLIVKKRRKENE